MTTANIRSSVAAIQTMLAVIVAECNIIDAQAQPSTPLPAVDCLAGTVPLWDTSNLYSDEASEAPWLSARSTFRTTMANAPSGSVMLIGDSMLERLGTAGAQAIHPSAVNLGISSESLRQLLIRINEPDINNNPNLIHRCGATVIMTGVNDLSDVRNYYYGPSTPEGVQNLVTTMGQIFDKLAGWVTGKVVIVKMVRLNTAVFTFPANSVIDQVNALIDAKFGNRPGFAVVDVNPVVAPGGSLQAQYSSDGQHLDTAEGKTALQNAIISGLQSII